MFGWLFRAKEIKKPIIYPKPVVDMLLEDRVWGRDWAEIKIVRVSKDEKDVQYKYTKIEGDIISTRRVHTATWKLLSSSMYTIIKDEEI